MANAAQGVHFFSQNPLSKGMARPSKAASLRLIDGEYDASRIKNTPKANGPLRKPRGLAGQAGKVWERIVPKLIDAGVATNLDQFALESLCRWWAVYQTASKTLEKLDPTSNEGVKALRASTVAFDNFRRLAEQFALTPKSRNQIDLKVEEKNEDIERFFSG